MKKVLAILLSGVLLFSSLACGMVLTTSADDAASFNNGFYYDFSTRENFENLTNAQFGDYYVVGYNPGDQYHCNASFDAEAQAMKISYNIGFQVQLNPNGAYKVDENDYPILAFKVKHSGKYIENNANKRVGPHFRYISAASDGGSGQTNGQKEYQQDTTEWQLMTIDLSTIGTLSGSYGTIQLHLDEYGSFNGTEKTMWIQWAGLFKTEAEAKTHYAKPIVLGKQLRQRDDALRFGFSVNVKGIDYTPATHTAKITQNTTIDIAGTPRQVTDIGAILTAKPGMVVSDLTVEAAEKDNKIVKASAQKVYSLIGDTATFIMTITNAGQSPNSRFYARSYVAYIGENSATQYHYSDMVSTTVSAYNIEYPITPTQTVQRAAEKLTNQGFTSLAINKETVRVAPYDPDYAFTHQQGMAFFKGKLYVVYSRGEKHEDYPGQEMVVVSSSDFQNWSTPQVIAPSRQGTYGKTTIVTGSLYSAGDRLYAYCSEHNWGAGKFEDGSFNPNGTNEGYTSRVLVTFTEDGVNWSEPTHLGFTSHESPRQTLTGEWLASYGAGMLYSDRSTPDGLHWKRVGLSTEQIKLAKEQYKATMLGECSWYQTNDGVINMVMRSDVVRDGKQVFEAFLAQSYDGGKTWTDAYPAHNFRLDWQMLNMGRLPGDSGYYFVGTINPENASHGRYPLYLMVSKDGYTFDKAYVLGDDVYIMQQDGLAKGGQYGYPEVLIHDEYMYVVCSRMKEVIEVTRIKLSDIK